jgi:hypothetical protein
LISYCALGRALTHAPSKLARSVLQEQPGALQTRGRFDAPSKLAFISSLWSGSHAGPTAPLDEHRLYKWSCQARTYSLRGGAGLISYCGLSHPPILRTSRRALCPTTSIHYINGISKLACCASFEGYACRSHCARGGSTSLDFTIRLVPRAHSGSRGAMCVSFISCSGVRVRRAKEINQPFRPGHLTRSFPEFSI